MYKLYMYMCKVSIYVTTYICIYSILYALYIYVYYTYITYNIHFILCPYTIYTV